jgi:hypothetical protein
LRCAVKCAVKVFGPRHPLGSPAASAWFSAARTMSSAGCWDCMAVSYILVAHRLYHGSQISGLLQDSCPVIVTPAIQDQVIGKSSLVRASRNCFAIVVRWPERERLDGKPIPPAARVTHGRSSAPLAALPAPADRHEDDLVVPVDVFDAHTVKLSFMSSMTAETGSHDQAPETRP